MNLSSFLESLTENWNQVLNFLLQEAELKFEEKSIDIDEINSNYDKMPNTFGVYLFKITPSEEFSLAKFKHIWKPVGKSLKRPSIIKNNCNEAKPNIEYNFYLGKSEKLLSRIKEHCLHDIDKATYGLKLKEEEYLYQSKITVSYFALNDIEKFKPNKEVLQFVITNLEKELRMNLKPWIGKQ